MNINRVSALLRRHGLALFTPGDLAIFLPQEDRRLVLLELHQWSRKGWVARLKRGLYELAYPEPAVLPDFHVANRLYQPSYVSLDAALSHYQLIPETAAQVTSVTPKPTRRFSNRHGLFLYFSVRPQAFTGYGLAAMQGAKILIAEPEKAVADRLYAALRRGEGLEPAERWDREGLRRLDRRKLKAYAALYGPAGAKLEERIHALLR